MKKDFYDSVKLRRTIYGIGKDKVVSEARIEEIIKMALKHTPTAFNSQSGRILLLFAEESNKFWDITKEILKKIVPEEKFGPTADKMKSFRSGYGTVLFFEDKAIVESLQNRFKLYKDYFPKWSQNSSGILQYIVWTSLEIEGLGASLQHYGSLVQEKVELTWNIPSNWELVAQMPFGNIIEGPGDKEFLAVEDRIKIFK